MPRITIDMTTKNAFDCLKLSDYVFSVGVRRLPGPQLLRMMR
jgi:hypothetical protein